MNNIDDRKNKLYEYASGSQGYFTIKQALSAGYTYRLAHYHKEKGHWQDIDRGVFRLSNYPDSEHEELVRWSLWSRNRDDIPQAVISHETALDVYNLSDVMPSKIHLTVPPGFQKKPPDICILHRRILSPDVIKYHNGFQITTPLQTLIDCAETNLSSDYLEQAVRDAFRQGILVPANILDTAFSPKAKEKMRFIIENIRKNPLL